MAADRSTAKKMMLKNSRLSGTWWITGKVARMTGTAPRSPAQPSSARSRWLNPSFQVVRGHGEGPSDNGRDQGQQDPLEGNIAELAWEYQ